MVRPQLKAMVAEAAQALAGLEVERLDELVQSCQALNQDSLSQNSSADRHALVSEARAAKREMAALAKVLEFTRANAAVIERIRLMRTSRLEYEVVPLQIESIPPEDGHGHH